MKIPSWLKWVGFLMAAAVTLVALAVALENLRGKAAWNQCVRELEAGGESLDWRTFVPPAVPDDENFAMTPLLVPLHDYSYDPKTRQAVWKDSAASERPKNLFNWRIEAIRPGARWRKGDFVDLAAWQTTLRGETNSKNAAIQALLATAPGTPEADLMFLLSQNQAELDEIQAAGRRPHVQFKVHYDEAFSALLPQLAVLRNFASAFETRALVRLHLGETEAACSDIQSVLAMSRAAESEPLLIATLVRIATLELALQPIYEGLARHQWTEPQLVMLQNALAPINLPAEALRSLRGERAFNLMGLDVMKKDPGAADFGEGGLDFQLGALRHLPSGFVYQNRKNIAVMYQDLVFPVYDPTNRAVDLERNKKSAQEVSERLKSASLYTVFARLLFPAVERVAEKIARAQSSVDLATTACALERYRLAHQEYPPDLATLVPQFLPRVPLDVVSRRPLIYRRAQPDRFVLYSVGLNGKDDGGTPALDKNGKPTPDRAEGDWVWYSGPTG
jgi:hypothetical protein